MLICKQCYKTFIPLVLSLSFRLVHSFHYLHSFYFFLIYVFNLPQNKRSFIVKITISVHIDRYTIGRLTYRHRFTSIYGLYEYISILYTNFMIVLETGPVLNYSNPVLTFIFLYLYSLAVIVELFALSTLFSRPNIALGKLMRFFLFFKS